MLMKTEFSPTWKSSVQQRKQRKYRYNAPLHIRRKFISANLAKDLRKEFGTRSATLVKGDVVRVLRGSHKGDKGPIERIDIQETKIYVKDVKDKKANGTDVMVPVDPWNLQIVELHLKDKKRAERLKGKKKAAASDETKAAKK